ncbi:hypothetical protein SAMN03097699_2323 [Flavobacteriaceae bacterium MAR_2010_188]|nr:hypothetical protein SAMN03097699_2323 [Flavobacteriaceae bacterium MAR_2010_188]
MKTLLTLIFLVALPLASLAQNENETVTQINSTKNVETIKKENVKASDSSVAYFKSSKDQLLYTNYKKSSDLTSIKAFRKSLQIKVKSTLKC